MRQEQCCCCHFSRRKPWPELSPEMSVAKREGSWLQRPAGPWSASRVVTGTTLGEAARLLSHQSCPEWVEKQLAPGRAVRRERPGEAQDFPGGYKNQKELGAPRMDSGSALCSWPHFSPQSLYKEYSTWNGIYSNGLPPWRGEVRRWVKGSVGMTFPRCRP